MIIYPKSYCVFDFETSGLDHTKDRIIEIGALRVEEGKPAEQLSWLINWGPDFQVPEIITQITNINTSMLSLGHEPAVAWQEFVTFTKNLPLVGHNIINFDIKFLEAAQSQFTAARLFDIPKVKQNCVDTAPLYKASKLKADRFYNESLYDFCARVMEIRAYGVKFNVGVCCDELGIDRSKATQHRAEGDVFLTNEIYKKICLKLK